MLNSPQFAALPLAAVRPAGWLSQQLRLQADGISGHLDEFWPDVQRSGWFGGDTESWERAPYWLDGLVPLAFLLDDPVLIGKAHRYVGYVIEHQDADGWLGPRQMVVGAGQAVQPRYDLWAQQLMLKVLVQYADATGDERAVVAVERALRCMDRVIDTAPLFNWGQFRWFETLIGLYWLYERTREQWLIDLAVKIHAQGFDWPAFFAAWPQTEPTPQGRWNYMGHVVNNAMAPKGPALWWRLSGDERDRVAAYDIIAKLDRYHGMVTGVFSGDECIAGLSPTQGTELCAVVEYAYSLELLLSLVGDPAFGDRLEKIVFNALPATFSPDMWAHQYDQQVNQVECSIRPDRIWKTNRADANTFGVEPDYGCCTANLSQGWPKFAAHLWMATQDGGLAAVAYAPSAVETTLGGQRVRVSLDTDYPFRETLHFTVNAENSVRFPLLLRIPAWARGATVSVAGAPPVPAEPGTFHRVERDWAAGTTELILTLPMTPALVERPRGAVAIERGPLVYALRIGEEWRRIHADLPYRELPHADWEVYPTTPWNYALDISPATLPQDVTFAEQPVGPRPFSPEGAPVVATARGRRLPGWQMERGSAAEVPVSPVPGASKLAGASSLAGAEPLETLTLIPYGCTNLRVTEFPVLERVKA